MKFRLTHHFDRPIDDVWSMMSDPDAHVAKFTSMGHHDLEIVSQDRDDDHLDLVVRRVVDMEVPSVAKKFVKPSNTVTSTDHWERRADGTLGGHYEVDIKGVPAETRGTTSVVPDGDGCEYAVELEVKVKVPLVGEKVAGALRPQLEKQIEEEFAAGDAWLSSH